MTALQKRAHSDRCRWTPGIYRFVISLLIFALALPALAQVEYVRIMELPFTTTRVKEDTTAEMEMLRLVNKERAAHKLPLLELDPKLQAAARAHSRDMFARGYFDHYSPDGTTHEERIAARGVRDVLASGENIALTQTVNGAHKSLMASPGHRSNILNPDYRRIGIGAVRSKEYGIMFTQEFTS